ETIKNQSRGGRREASPTAISAFLRGRERAGRKGIQTNSVRVTGFLPVGSWKLGTRVRGPVSLQPKSASRRSYSSSGKSISAPLALGCKVGRRTPSYFFRREREPASDGLRFNGRVARSKDPAHRERSAAVIAPAHFFRVHGRKLGGPLPKVSEPGTGGAPRLQRGLQRVRHMRGR
ncbi:unnamed protein product, partial [Phaeothamnion confervicola]